MRDTSRKTVEEAYAFACLRCGHGWERTFVIEHYLDPHGRPFVQYYADGEPVPSPLTHPRCPNCEGHRVRVLRPGRVAVVERAREWTAQPP